MGSFDGDDFVYQVWPIVTVFFGIILTCFFICFCCPCCPWYKRRRQGTVYQNITVPAGAQNATGYPITLQVGQPTQHVAYPVQQTVYHCQQACPPTQYVGSVQPCVAPYPTPAQQFGPPMPHQVPPYGQPPPYTEAGNMPHAPSAPDAYAKQAPFNPHYGADNH